MKRKLLLFTLFVIITVPFYGSTSRFYTGLGMNHNNFQDARFSDLIFTGNLPSFELGFDQSSAERYYFVEVGLTLGNGEVPFNPDNKIRIMEMHPELGYLHQFKMEGFYLGATLDLFNYTIRENDKLHNNSNFFLNSNDLLIAARYVKPLSNKIDLELQSEMGLLSMMKYAPSFTTNYPQNIIDNSMLSFHDGSVRNPVSWQYMVWKTGFNQTYLKFSAGVNWGRRWALNYSWRVRSFEDFEGYPLTMARHLITIRYNFVNKSK